MILNWLRTVTVLCMILGFVIQAHAEQDDSVIRIGAVIPLTGELAGFGKIQNYSYDLAVEEINASGGIKGRKLAVLVENDGGNPDVGRSAVEKLISKEKVVLLTGGYSSPVAYGIASLAQQHRIPYVVHTGAADNITERGWDHVFRINQTSSEYFKGLLSFLSDVAKPRTVAVIHENTLFGQSQGKSFSEVCEQKGYRVIVKEGFDSGTPDFKPILGKLKTANPDMLYAVCYAKDATLLIKQAKELDYMPKLWVGGGGGFSVPEFVKNAGPSVDYMYSATLWAEDLPHPGARAYFDKYLKRFGQPPQFQAAQAYVALYVIADALKRAKEIRPTAIREALATTDMMTIYGPVRFQAYDRKTQQNRLPTYLGQWLKGQFRLVWPKDYANHPFTYPIPPWSGR